MSWVCPFQVDDFCNRMRAKCKPGMMGCVIDKRASFIEPMKEGARDMACDVKTLDLRPLPPFERHQKIFQTWEVLEEGKALRIINDHDPKPLRYQFEAEYKNRYRWEYEKQGPRDWIVKIEKV